ncbi:histidine kinase [Streptomyces sp. NPDC050988]|uniref:sensor histidine kinase n=1 Tax=Streptomyces sp. NPDC050988 TaxID=3365637 RepID=UPI0037B265BF
MNELTGSRAARATRRGPHPLTRLATRRTAQALWAATVITAVAGAVLAVLSRATPRPDWHPWWLMVVEAPTGAVLAQLGLLVAVRRPGNPAGWLLLAAGSGASFDLFVHAYGLYAMPRGLAGAVPAMWATNWSFVFFGFPLMLLFLVFPGDRLPSAGRRFAARYVVACGCVMMLIGAFMPGPLGSGYFGAPNPAGIAALSFAVTHVGAVSVLMVLFPFLLSIASMLVRYRSSTGLVRRQLKWVAWAALVSVCLVTVHIVLLDGPAESLAMDAVPALLGMAIAIAITRHNLFNIDRLLSNTLMYAGLTAAVAGLYIGTVSAFGLLLRHSASGLAPLLATGVVAVLLQPLRAVLQRLVSRFVYGLRDDPYTALATLGRRLETTSAPKDVLPEAAATVAEALRLSYVAVELDGRSTRGPYRTRVATYGTEVEHPLRLALVHQGEEIGALLVGPRSFEEHFSAADLRLLRDVARHIAQAASAVRLALTLQRAQERAVAATAEERRRLARDLHDGVGPVLTGATWTLQAAVTKLRSDPGATHELLATTLIHIRQGTEDLRRISTGLRSPVDQLGLREAVLVHLDRVSLPVECELPDEIPRLPAAVEEAAYWILAEAVANVLRHADADTCRVSLELGDVLVLTVADDGSGLPGRFRPGVGMGSMRERAVEIGGSCEIRPRTRGGTEVVARLPFTLAGAEHIGNSAEGGIR